MSMFPTVADSAVVIMSVKNIAVDKFPCGSQVIFFSECMFGSIFPFFISVSFVIRQGFLRKEKSARVNALFFYYFMTIIIASLLYA